MATAPAVRWPGLTLHRRGTWSHNDDRIAPAVWLGILWVGMLAGFGVDLPRFVSENPPAPTVVYVHAAVFVVWLLLLTVQVTLVLSGHVAWHRKMGLFAVSWACLMAVLGPWAAMTSQAVNLQKPPPLGDPAFISVNIVDIGGFLALLGWGFLLRKNPAAHKRMMLLATISLADPGFSRFSGWLVPAPPSVISWFIYIFFGNVLLILLMGAWDWWKGRLMRSFVVGAAALLAVEFLASAVYFWEPWRELTTSWVVAWANL